MDSRRFQELRDVYSQLSQQSTGPNGSSPAASSAVPPPAMPSKGAAVAAGGQLGDSTPNSSLGLTSFGNSTAEERFYQRQLTVGKPDPGGIKGEESSMSASEERDGGGVGVAGSKRKRKRSERDSFYPASYFEWTEKLMANELPERANGSFVASIFELGLKHSSPKVLMKLMPPRANSLTTEHIKSRLQKYRLHAHRSKDEFLEFFHLRLQAKFEDFLQKEGWRNLSPSHGLDEQLAESEYDSAGGGDGVHGEGGGGGAAGPGSSDLPPAVMVDGQMVGDIRDLGGQCVREQLHLQEVLRQHISAQLKLQAEIHEHLTTAAPGSGAAAARPPPGSNSRDVSEAPAGTTEGRVGEGESGVREARP